MESEKFPNTHLTSGWSRLDRYARFISWVAKENSEDQDGIFYGKGLSDDIIHQRVWMVLQRSNQNNTPSHKRPPPPAERQSQRIKEQNTTQSEQSASIATATAGSKRKEPPGNSPVVSLEIDYSGSGSDTEYEGVWEGAEPKVPSEGLVPACVHAVLGPESKGRARSFVSALENELRALRFNH